MVTPCFLHSSAAFHTISRSVQSSIVSATRGLSGLPCRTINCSSPVSRRSAGPSVPASAAAPESAPASISAARSSVTALFKILKYTRPLSSGRTSENRLKNPPDRVK